MDVVDSIHREKRGSHQAARLLGLTWEQKNIISNRTNDSQLRRHNERYVLRIIAPLAHQMELVNFRKFPNLYSKVYFEDNYRNQKIQLLKRAIENTIIRKSLIKWRPLEGGHPLRGALLILLAKKS